MRILLTGATGVIGRRLVPLLIGAGHVVTAVARSDAKRRRLEEAGASSIRMDLFDAIQVVRAVAGHDVVINLATHIPPAAKTFMPGAWRENDRIRSVASRHLLEAAIAAHASRFIQESFTGIYPDRGESWIREDTPVEPAAYARSLLDAERQAQHFTARGGTGVILRFALLYGPDSSHTTDTIRFVLKGKAPTLGRRESFISSVSTADAAAAVLAALHVPAGVYNVADDTPVPRRVYFGSLANTLGVAEPWFTPAWLAHLFGGLGETIARSHRISNEKLKHASGWTPHFPSVLEGWPHVAPRASIP